ncbi:DnaK suppressor protein [Serratia marcescens]|uniref:TraR/DksA C4-type zinc finger protein n=1 Tax=Serratia ureilytica TaxID=300181 RepID=A0ABU0VKM2_9GAMM|nr:MULTISPECIES: TraR/DksA C4-type zinc finger protein [Serratia]EMC1042081.1 TraR/DksA C4-type zinc finger protein [Serratia marcescens]MCU7060798.1 TraR/DksA C4-type zinc finger protein [Serratia ureilytica]MDQ1810292.1 TraR/DksA C4-type zinc finger protein [Serratia ureilytica]MDQ1839472.1 TraR/DksA C4-type zinc finger protein [Serratia ureilytica]MDQ1861788.1 TraR/DksA C4-type zinc finger protein [Serratia ureilytica]
MADLMDYEQERQALVLEAQITNARKSSALPSAFVCEECDAPIPAARRAAVPGVDTCVSCQQIRETKSHLYAGKA